jgi:hypothetical protein
VWRRRWKWVEDSAEWRAFAGWRDARAPAERVELEAGLEMLLDYGPEHDSPQVGDDLYAVYACCKRTIFWLVVGVARPGEKRLLPLAWGTDPSKNLTSGIKTEAAKMLREWRSAA